LFIQSNYIIQLSVTQDYYLSWYLYYIVFIWQSVCNIIVYYCIIIYIIKYKSDLITLNHIFYHITEDILCFLV